MDNWYEVKKDMEEQHAKHMAELKRIYESSKESFVKEEKLLKERCSTSLDELRKIEFQKKDAIKLANDIQGKINNLTSELAAIDKQLIQKKGEFRGLTVEIEKKDNILKQSQSDLLAKQEEVRLWCEKRRGELGEEHIILDSKIKQNQELLDKLKEEQNIISQRKSSLEVDRNKFNDDRKAFNDLKVSTDKKLVKCEEDKDENKKERAKLSKKETELEGKFEILKKREKELKALEQKQKDKDIDIEFRENDVRRKEDNVNKLIEIHKLKGKV